jgi:hypothetical protein
VLVCARGQRALAATWESGSAQIRFFLVYFRP